MSYIIKGRVPKHALLRSQDDGGIPYDVAFKVRNEEMANEDGVDIMAHKVIVASFSPVFKNMFYGALMETRDIIPIDDTTPDAFKKLMDYFYQVDINCEDMSLHELFELVNLAERYDVPELMNELIGQFGLVPVTMENVVELATIATRFKTLFEAASSALMLGCAKHLQKKVNSDQAKVKFLMEQHANGNGLVALELVSSVKTLPLLRECSNCLKKDCLVGKDVLKTELREGLKVKLKEEGELQHFWSGVTSVTRVRSFKVAYVCSGHFWMRNQSSALIKGDSGQRFAPMYNNVPTLVYDC